jgi:hypothetical protein
VVVLAPVFVLVAALGTRTGLWSYATGHDLLAMRIGAGLAAFGAVAALALVIFALRRLPSIRASVSPSSQPPVGRR